MADLNLSVTDTLAIKAVEPTTERMGFQHGETLVVQASGAAVVSTGGAIVKSASDSLAVQLIEPTTGTHSGSAGDTLAAQITSRTVIGTSGITSKSASDSLAVQVMASVGVNTGSLVTKAVSETLRIILAEPASETIGTSGETINPRLTDGAPSLNTGSILSKSVTDSLRIQTVEPGTRGQQFSVLDNPAVQITSAVPTIATSGNLTFKAAHETPSIHLSESASVTIITGSVSKSVTDALRVQAVDAAAIIVAGPVSKHVSDSLPIRLDEETGVSPPPSTGMFLRIHQGIDRTAMLMAGTLQLDDELNARHTLAFTLDPGSTGFVPLIGMQVDLYQSGVHVFGGTIDDYTLTVLLGTKRQYYACNCVSWTQLADRKLVAKEYNNTLAGDIVRDIITDELALDGVTATGVQDGPVIAHVVWNYQAANRVMDSLCQATGFSWYIDSDKVMHFFARETYAAPFTIRSDNQTAMNLTIQETRAQYRNVQMIRAGNDITDVLTESFAGDGQTNTFTLSYALAAQPTIVLNPGAIAQTVGIRSVDTGKDFYWQSNDNQLTQDFAATKLTTSQSISITYQGFYPIRVIAQDDMAIAERAALEGGSGSYELLELDQTIDRRILANDRAASLLRQFARIQGNLSFTTDLPGLRTGMLLTVNVPEYGLSATYLVSRVRWRDLDGKNIWYDIEAADGEYLGGWIAFFHEIADAGRDFIVQADTIVELVRRFPDTASVADAYAVSFRTETEAHVDVAISDFSELLV